MFFETDEVLSETAHDEARKGLGKWCATSEKLHSSESVNNYRRTAPMASRVAIQESEHLWRAYLEKHLLEADLATSLGHEETVKGIFAGYTIMRLAGEAARATVTRQKWDNSCIGRYDKMGYAQRTIHGQILVLSPLMARIYETACLGGWLHVRMPSLPAFEDFMDKEYLLVGCAGTFTSNGEGSGAFNDKTVLSTFLVHLYKDMGVSGVVFFMVVDMLPPMATYIPRLHDEDATKKLLHIDSIQFFKHLAPSLQEVLRCNLHELVIILPTARENVLVSAE